MGFSNRDIMIIFEETDGLFHRLSLSPGYNLDYITLVTSSVLHSVQDTDISLWMF